MILLKDDQFVRFSLKNTVFYEYFSHKDVFSPFFEKIGKNFKN